MVSILSDLKATFESALSIGSAAVSGARDLIFRNTAGTIRIRGTPTGDHTITAPAATGTMVVSGQDATLNSLTVDTANITIEAKEQSGNAGLTVSQDATGVAFVDLKRLGGAQGTNFGLRISLESDTFAGIFGGSNVVLGVGPVIRTWQGNPLAQEIVGTASTFTTLRYSTGDWVGTRIPTWDIQRTGASVSDLSFYRYDDTGVTATEHLRLTRSSGLTTLFGDVTLSHGTTMPQLSVAGPNRSVLFQPTGNNLGIEYRNALSGGVIYADWTLDAGSDYFYRDGLFSATEFRSIGVSGLTKRHLVDVTFEQSITFGSATGATARSFGLRNSAGTITITGTPTANATQTIQARSGTIANLDQTLLVANNLSDIGFAPTARTNLGLGTIATQNATAIDVAGKRTAINITGNVTLDSSHIGRKLLVTSGPADITFPSGVGTQGDEIEIVVFTTSQVRVVQGAGATLTWQNGTSAVTGTRTLLGNGAMAAIIYSAAGAAAISGGLS